jgi:tripeptide aminopeptidase
MDFTKAFETTADRFIRYAKIDTQADPASSSSPSTAKQKNLSVMLFQELTAAGIQAETDEFGYVYARIPANNADKKSKIFFCAHVDTAPDCSGTDVKPILHEHYNGGDLVLPDDSTVVISPADFPDLNQKIGLGFDHRLRTYAFRGRRQGWRNRHNGSCAISKKAPGHRTWGDDYFLYNG